MKSIKKILLSFVAVVLGVTGSLGAINTSSVTAHADTISDDVNYEVYPTPHSFEYGEGDFVVRQDVNVIYEDSIDAATKKRLNLIMDSKSKNVTVGSEVVSGKSNIILGVFNEGGYADKYIQENYDVDASLFEKTDSYFLSAHNGELVVLGKDTDAVFYGLTSLMHIFDQIDGSTIRNFEIKDYADTAIRGFIEGYYGVPWTNADRISLMEFGGQFKATSYIFAPKDDPYHTSKWREPYPEAELEGIREMVQAGIDSKTNFVWTAHPFMGGFNANDVDGEIAALIAKFEQLYDLGVRQFGILGDDVGSLDLKIVVRIMNELSEWGATKGDLYDFVFCPAGYNTGWANWNELNTYDAGFPEDVQIFWTGDSVCAPISKQALNNFRNNNATNKRRSPLFWLNWPVNDINMNRLMMGKGSLLHTDIDVDDLYGAVTNPMQDAEPSKVAIFAVADYAWNIKDFNDDKSWEDSFKYIDADAPEALHTIAKHTSDPAPNGHGLVLEESEEIKPLLDAFNTALDSNNKADIIKYGMELNAEMDKIIVASKEFVETSKNERMVEQIEPFAKALSDLAESLKGFVNATLALKDNDSTLAWDEFSNASTLYDQSKKHPRLTINGTKSALPGSKRLTPFVDKLVEKISDDINEIISGGEASLTLTAETNLSKYEGDIKNIIDGDAGTHFWSNQFEKVGQYFQVNLSKPTTIYGVNILNGNKGKPEDTFGYGKVQYTTDGTTWQDMTSEKYGPYAVSVDINDVEIDNVIGVRYICDETDSGNKWPAMREFKIKFEKEGSHVEFDKEVFYSNEWTELASGAVSNIIDGDDNTGVWFKTRHSESFGDKKDHMLTGDYLGLKLSEPIILGKIKMIGGHDSSTGDYMKNYKLEYSMDGITYTTVDSYTNKRDLNIDLSDQNITAQYVRLTLTQDQKNWVGFREFSVEQKADYNGKVYTNVADYKDLGANYSDESSMMGSATVTLEKDQYVGLKLSRVRELVDIDAKTASALTNVKLEASANGYEWTDVSALSGSIDARYVRFINKGAAAETVNIEKLVVDSLEYQDFTVSDTSYTTIAMGSPEKLFDKDWSTGLKYQAVQKKGDYIILDLGQDIDLDTLKIVCHDSNVDYIRDGLVYVSLDGSTWGAPVIEIGDQQPNLKANDGTIMESFPNHEISYNTASAENINQKVRYIKIEITQDYTHRWTQINEVVINDGEYISTVNDPTFKSSSRDTFNGFFENLVDGDLTTMFVPEDETGSLTYTVSENNKYNQIKIVQDGQAITDAKVEARVFDATTATSKWVELGTLSQSINEFSLEDDSVVLDVRVSWTDGQLKLLEMIRSEATYVEADKTELQTLISNPEDTSTWTTSAKKEYKDALDAGQKVLDSSAIAQSSIDSMVSTINRLIDNKQVSGDITALQALIDNKLVDAENYTVKTFRPYERALTMGVDILNDAPNYSQTDIDAAVKAIDTAKAALVFNPAAREQLQVYVEDVNVFVDGINSATENNPTQLFTKNSFVALTTAKDDSEALLLANQTDAKHPEEFKTMLTKVTLSKAALVDTVALNQVINDFDKTEASLYTTASYTAYKTEAELARKLLVDGDTATITAAVTKVQAAKDGLVLAPSTEALDTLIAQIDALDVNKYTVVSVTAAQAKVAEVKAIDLNAATEAEIASYVNELNAVIDGLVNVEALKTVQAVAQSYKAEAYTIDSYKGLAEALEAVEKELKEGTDDSVAKLIESLTDAMNDLVARLDAAILDSYLKDNPLKAAQDFTKESYSPYKTAYDELAALNDDLANTSLEDYQAAVNKLEETEAALRFEHKVDSTVELESVLDKAKAYKQDKYTEESYARLAQAIEEAEALLNRLNTRGVITQAQVDKAVANLELAISKLELKEDKKEGTDEKEVIKPEVNVGEKDQPKNEKEAKKEDVNNPSTGIETTYLMPVVVLFMSLAVLLLMRRKENN